MNSVILNLLGFFLILHRRCLISYGMYYNRNLIKTQYLKTKDFTY
nr:MAG TPA: hypothetical protein [Caudoviricetes sp.]